MHPEIKKIIDKQNQQKVTSNPKPVATGAVQAICPRCHQQLGTNSRNCTTCYLDIEGRD